MGVVCLRRDHLHGCLPGAVGGDLGVPALAGDDDGLELAQQRAGDDRLGLGRGQPVPVSGGEVNRPEFRGGSVRWFLFPSRAAECQLALATEELFVGLVGEHVSNLVHADR